MKQSSRDGHRLPRFLLQMWKLASPSQRRAARERRREYEAQFEQLKEENLHRVRRMSQLYGHEDVSDFLFDSAHGTGASIRSMSVHDSARPCSASARDPSLTASTRRRPCSMILDPSPGWSPSLSSRASTAVRPASSMAPSSSSLASPTLTPPSPSTSFPRELDSGNPLNAAASAMSPPVGTLRPPTGGRRHRPFSLPAAVTTSSASCGSGKLRKRKLVDRWIPPETTPEMEQEYDGYVQGGARP